MWVCPLLIQLAKGEEGKGDGRGREGEAQGTNMASRSAPLCVFERYSGANPGGKGMVGR